MAGYVLKRLLRSVLSLVAVIFIIMLLVFQLMNRDAVIAKDSNYSKQKGNNKIVYKYNLFSKYEYVTLKTYSEYASNYAKENNITFEEAYDLPQNVKEIEEDSTSQKFIDTYSKKGYKIVCNSKTADTDSSILIAYKDRNIFERLWNFFSHLFFVDYVGYAKQTEEDIAKCGKIKRGIYITKDPINGGLCIMGSGTKNKYLLYFDNVYPFVHQNFITLNLGTRFQSGEDFFSYFTGRQGSPVSHETVLPNGEVENSAFDYHRRVFTANISDRDYAIYQDQYVQDSSLYKDGLSMIGYSFIIGIISTILVYFIGVPLGLLLALKKDKIADKIGNLYIIFIMAVPSLAYIYMFATFGNKWLHLPNNWPTGTVPLVYFLPILSLALPSIATLMKWTRRYMIDQMTSDYVKFARSQGFSEFEIFRKHILKNALIPIVQGIPGSILGALTGAIVTERVYGVPGMGKLLTDAIDFYDNGVIVGISFFYALLSIASLILGDVLMAKVDPRISFSSGGGRK